MKKLPLHSEHEKLKAQWGPFADYLMPLQYAQGAKQESLLTRQSCGLFDVSHMGEFLVTGEEAIAFCDWLVAQDFLNIPVNKAQYALLCEEEGGVLDDLILYKLSSTQVLICVNASNREKDWNFITSQHKKGPYQKNLLQDVSSSYGLLALQGPSWKTVLSRAFSPLGLTIPSLDKLDKFECTSFSPAVVSAYPFVIARTGYTGEDGVEIFCPLDSKDSTEFFENLWKNLSLSPEVAPCGLAARDVLRIEAGLPLYGNELLEEISPFDAGLSWAMKKVSPEFLQESSERSFIGQKSLLERKKIPKWKTIKFSLESGIPRKDYEITNEKGEKVGVVTSGTFSPLLEKGIGIGRILVTEFNKGRFFVHLRHKLVPITPVTRFLNKN